MRELTIVLPHFCNVGMLNEQIRVWADYPADLAARVHVVVVDDCSPKAHRPTRKNVSLPGGLASFRLYRLLQKRRWNWLACRNLGAFVATTDWILLTDIDHVVPVETLRRMLDGDLNPQDAYRFKRVTAPSVWPYDIATAAPWKPHNDTWLLARDVFFDERVGGYDERLSGCYGTSGEFRDRLVTATRAQVILDQVIVRYPREVIPDASTPPSTYTRKGDPKNDEDLRKRKEARAQIPHWKPLRGTFPWELIMTSTPTPAEEVAC